MGSLALTLLLALAVVSDLRFQKIPNMLTLPGIILGIALCSFREGPPGLLLSLAGIGVAAFALLPYAVGGLGAGDVKMLMVVGALMGPVFILWTLLGGLFAAGLLGLGYVAHGALAGRVGVIKAARMPMAPAIALGALFAYWRMQGGAG